MNSPSDGQAKVGGELRIEDMGRPWWTCRVDDGACGSPPDVCRTVAHPLGEQRGGSFGDAESLDEEPTVAAGAETCTESHTITLASGQRKLPFFCPSNAEKTANDLVELRFNAYRYIIDLGQMDHSHAMQRGSTHV